MPEITDLKAGSVPTEEELLGLLEKATPGLVAGHASIKRLAEVLRAGVKATPRASTIPGNYEADAALFLASVTALPSLIAAKAQAEAKVKELENGDPKFWLDRIAKGNELLHAAEEQRETAESRLAFVRDTLTRLMERHGGPLSREATITLSGGTIADWLASLGSTGGEYLVNRTVAAEVENAMLREALTEIIDGTAFNQQRFAEDDDTDYFLRCFKAVKERARSALEQKGGG